MFHPFFKLVKKTYIALDMLRNRNIIYDVGAQYEFLSNSHGNKYGKENGCVNVPNYGNLININNSACFKNEESRCVHAQKTVIVNEKDHLDWSFDPKDIYQGENWKKNEKYICFFV